MTEARFGLVHLSKTSSFCLWWEESGQTFWTCSIFANKITVKVSNLIQKVLEDVGGQDTHLTDYLLCNRHKNICILPLFTPNQFCDRNIPIASFIEEQS